MPAATKSKPAATSQQIYPVDYQLAKLPLSFQAPSTAIESSRPQYQPVTTADHWKGAAPKNIHTRSHGQATEEALKVPTWLSTLTVLQRSSTLVTFILVAGVLAVYGCSVYSQRAWSQDYRQLTHLQRQERELIAASETRKQQIVQQAESLQAGLVRQAPANTVFLQPEPLRPAQRSEPQLPSARAPGAPLGY